MNHYYAVLRRNVANNNNNNNNNNKKAIIRRTIIRSTSSTTSTRSRIDMNSNNMNMNMNLNININININIALIGPPGSGKGSYGKHFANALQIPIFTVSDLLKKFRPDINISSGKLIDDTIVSETILQGLEDHFDNNDNDNGVGGYIIDGFPRTTEQIKLTEEDFETTGWPEKYRIQSAIHLNVPDHVCKTKILGRRQCSKCGKSYNIANVDWNGWIMPSNMPLQEEEHICVGSNDNKNNNDNNNDNEYQHQKPTETALSLVSCDWSIRRDDDTTDIIERRLEVYHYNSDPILEYFKDKKQTQNSNSNSLLTLTPYHGFDDLPILVNKIHKWTGSDRVDDRI
jgi:adenylate kinase